MRLACGGELFAYDELEASHTVGQPGPDVGNARSNLEAMGCGGADLGLACGIYHRRAPAKSGANPPQERQQAVNEDSSFLVAALFQIAHFGIPDGARVVVQNNAQQRAVDFKMTVVGDET